MREIDDVAIARDAAMAEITAIGGHITVIEANEDEWLIKAVPPKGHVWLANGVRQFVTTIGARQDQRTYGEWQRVRRVIGEGVERAAKVYPRLRVAKREFGWTTTMMYGPGIGAQSSAIASTHAEAIAEASKRLRAAGYPSYKLSVPA